MTQLRDTPEDQELREAMTKRAEEVAEALQGTAKNLDDESTEEERGNDDFTSRLDELVLECETCGWWCETGEICKDGHCGDCHGDVCDGDHDDEEED